MDGIMQKIGASVVCEALINEGVNVIFGHPGGAILPFYDALWHYPQIRHVLVRHEQAAAHAAEATRASPATWASASPRPVPARRT